MTNRTVAAPRHKRLDALSWPTLACLGKGAVWAGHASPDPIGSAVADVAAHRRKRKRELVRDFICTPCSVSGSE